MAHNKCVICGAWLHPMYYSDKCKDCQEWEEVFEDYLYNWWPMDGGIFTREKDLYKLITKYLKIGEVKLGRVKISAREDAILIERIEDFQGNR